MLKKKKKCELCKKNSLAKDPYAIEAMDENDQAYKILICDECAKLLTVISEKSEQMLQDRLTDESF